MRVLPRKPDTFYDRILLEVEQDGGGQESHRALQWLIFTARSISLKEPAEAVIIRPDPEPPYLNAEDRFMDYKELLEILPSGLVSVVQVEWGIYDYIAQLPGFGEESDYYYDEEEESGYEEFEDDVVEVSSVPDDEALDHSEGARIERYKDETQYKMTVRLAHFSVKEYLLSTRIKTSIASTYHIDEISSHSCIAQSCIAYLFFVGNQKPDLTKEIFKIFPLPHYAANCWPYHIQKLG